RTASKMCDGGDPAACTEVLGNGLRVMAAAAAFQAVENDHGRGIWRLLQLPPVGILHPPPRCRLLQLRIGLGMSAVGPAVGEQRRPRPIEIKEVAVGGVYTFPNEGDVVMANDKRPVKGLRVPTRQPPRRRTGRGVNASGHVQPLVISGREPSRLLSVDRLCRSMGR